MGVAGTVRARRLCAGEQGAGIIEYALLLAVLAVGLVFGIDRFQAAQTTNFDVQAATLATGPEYSGSGPLGPGPDPVVSPPPAPPEETDPPEEMDPPEETDPPEEPQEPVGPDFEAVTFGSGSLSRSGINWSASLVVTLPGTTGETVYATYSLQPGGATGAMTCALDASGSCTLSVTDGRLSGGNAALASIVVTVTDVGTVTAPDPRPSSEVGVS